MPNQFTQEELDESQALANMALVHKMPVEMMQDLIDAVFDRAADLDETRPFDQSGEAANLRKIALNLHKYISVDVDLELQSRDEEQTL